MSAVELRPVDLEDAGWVADLLTAARPDEPETGARLAHRWLRFRPGFWRFRQVVLRDGRPAGYVGLSHAPWEAEPQRVGRVMLRLLPDASGLVPVLAASWEAALRAEGAARVSVDGPHEDEGEVLGRLRSAGYETERVARVWELDLVAEGARLLALAAESRRRMAEEGLELLTLAADRDPEVWRKLADLNNEAIADVPQSAPIHPVPEAELRAELSGPETPLDRLWLARDGAVLAAHSHLTFPTGPGHSWTGFTCCARAYRGRGVARAVKLETLAQAIELGVPRVRTANDAGNAPILHINQVLGYRPLPGEVTLARDLS